MFNENKFIIDLRQFIDARISKGRVLDVDQIGLLFLCVSEAAQGPAYKGVSTRNIDPIVRRVVADYILQGEVSRPKPEALRSW